ARVPGVCQLTVRILQARGLPSKDLVTPSDCYVTLWLPTASSHVLQTRTVKNSRNPVWNQSFHFRIHSQLKVGRLGDALHPSSPLFSVSSSLPPLLFQNVVQLKVFDQDLLTKDDPVLSVLFDASAAHAGRWVDPAGARTYARLSDLPLQGEGQLDVEFQLRSLSDCAEQLVSNGILVARELSCLHVRLEEAGGSKGRVQLEVPGSCEGLQEASVGTGSFQFHFPACWEQELSVRLQDAPQEQLKVPLSTLPSGQLVRLVFPTSQVLEEESQEPLIKVELRKEEGPKEPAVRLGYVPCAEEQAFLSRRKQVVAQALKRALQLDRDLQEDETPVVAIMATGGGIRAMTSLYGQLAGLRELGLLDCVSYITGASGSTWALANLYEDPEWSQKDLAGPTELLKSQVTKSKLGVLAPSQLQRYRRELAERAHQGHPPCFTHLWALINEALLHDEPHDHKLSDQREALSRGQNPLPIYCALNTKGQSLTTFEFGEWCEFSPYEVGFPKYGAFIPSELFGSEFFMGRLTKQLPESRICFLEGIWSNLYAANLQDSLYWASEPGQFWDRWVHSQATLGRCLAPCKGRGAVPRGGSVMGWLPGCWGLQRPGSSSRGLRFLSDSPSCCADKEQVPLLKVEEPPTLAGRIAEYFTDLLTRRPLAQATHNFLRGLHFHRNYFEHPLFSAWRGACLPLLPAPRVFPDSGALAAPDAPSLDGRPSSLLPRVQGSSVGLWQEDLPLLGVGRRAGGASVLSTLDRAVASAPSFFPATKLDGLPNQLTPGEPHLCLLDVGYLINTSCTPLLRPTRDVDLILSLDYNLNGAFQQLQLLGRFCQEQGIPFPPISPSAEEQRQPRECQLFSHPHQSEAPAVLHFPLVNDSFREHSAPGVQRTPEEKAAGEVNLSSPSSPYHYSKVTYSQEDADKLLRLARYNICNNREQLLAALRGAVQRRQRRPR
ncbi:Cytosolic phospholipase A2 beta, partial [Galemys pyrenaicus]